MKIVFQSQDAVAALYRKGLPFFITTTEKSVNFFDAKTQKLLSSVNVEDAGICDVSDNGRYVAIRSPLGVFLIDTIDNNKTKFFSPKSPNEDQSLHAYFAGNQTLIVCCSWLEIAETTDQVDTSSHSSVHYIDTESFKEIAAYRYPDTYAASCFKSGKEIFIHLQPRVDESHEDFEAMNHFLYSYLLRIDCENPAKPHKIKVNNVDRIYDYNSINKIFLVQRPIRSILFSKPVEIVDEDMKTIAKLPNRILTMHACWINSGRSILTLSASGIYEFDAKSLKQIAKMKGMTSGICNYSFYDPHVGVFTSNGAVILRSENI